jgi:hypothetical protein
MTRKKNSSPSSSSILPYSEGKNSSETWKKHSLVGKMWEVFWTPDNDTSACFRTPSSPNCTNNMIAGANKDDGYVFDADWYDARITSYLPEIDKFEVAFVGEDKVHLMSLNPKFVRPLEGSGPDYYEPNVDRSFDLVLQPTREYSKVHSEVDADWAKSIVGKDVEVFWEEETNVDTSSTEDKSFQRYSNENNEHNSDWYDARVESFDSVTGFFRVTFLGDERHYEMMLKQETVRPSVRAWVNRTVNILNLTVDQISNNHDEKMLKEDLYGMPSNSMHGNNQKVRPGCEDDMGMIHMDMLLQQQLVLLPSLKFGSCDVNDSQHYKTFNLYGKMHVDYLTNRIQLALELCKWYSCHRWNTFSNEILHMQNTDHNVDCPKVSITDLYSSILNGLKLFMKLLPFDCSGKPRIKSKRPYSETLTRVAYSSSKRRKRYEQAGTEENDIYTGNNILFDKDTFLSNLAACENSDDEHNWNKMFTFLNNALFGKEVVWPISPRMVNFLHCEFTETCNPRFLSHKICNAIETLLNRVWLPVIEWIHSAKNAVGEVYGIQMDKLDSVAQGYVKLSQTSTRHEKCSMEEIKMCIETGNQNELLKRINLDMHLNFLVARLRDIETFQKEARNTILNCMNDALCLQSMTAIVTRDDIEQHDETLHKLHALLRHEACARSDTVDQSSKYLTETTIHEAIELRRWIILCKWIGTKRERRITVEEALEQQPSANLFMLTKYEGAKVLCRDNLVLQLKQRLSLYPKDYVIDWDNLNSESCCQCAIDEISTANILLEDEEKLLLMADAFKWNRRATSMFSQKVDFNQVEEMYRTLLDLKKGISSSRLAITRGMLQDKRIDASVAGFASRQISTKFRDMDKLVTRVFQMGWAWSKKAKHIIHTLKHHGNSSLSGCSFGGVPTKVSTVIDLKAIEELLNDHDNELFDFPSVVTHLRNARNDANNWVRGCLSILLNESSRDIHPNLLLLSLEKKIIERPKG